MCYLTAAMRWPVFCLFVFLALVFQLGLRTLLRDPFGIDAGEPQFLLILGVFIGLSAPGKVTPWAWLILGALVDLANPVPVRLAMRETQTTLLGPACLGYLLGGYAVWQLRPLVVRDSPLAVAFVAFCAGMLVQLAIVATLSVRGLPWPWLAEEQIASFRAADELVRRFLELIYTTLFAIPLGALLIRLRPMWGFPTAKGGR